VVTLLPLLMRRGADPHAAQLRWHAFKGRDSRPRSQPGTANPSRANLVDHRSTRPVPVRRDPRRIEPTGGHIGDSGHTLVTNSVDAPEPQVSDQSKRSRPGSRRRQKTVSPTCARWYPVRHPRSGPGRLPARQGGIAGCASVSHSPARPSHVSPDLTSPERIRRLSSRSPQQVGHCRDPRGSRAEDPPRASSPAVLRCAARRSVTSRSAVGRSRCPACTCIGSPRSPGSEGRRSSSRVGAGRPWEACGSDAVPGRANRLGPSGRRQPPATDPAAHGYGRPRTPSSRRTLPEAPGHGPRAGSMPSPCDGVGPQDHSRALRADVTPGSPHLEAAVPARTAPADGGAFRRA
jgi:hypothetical protein